MKTVDSIKRERAKLLRQLAASVREVGHQYRTGQRDCPCISLYSGPSNRNAERLLGMINLAVQEIGYKDLRDVSRHIGTSKNELSIMCRNVVREDVRLSRAPSESWDVLAELSMLAAHILEGWRPPDDLDSQEQHIDLKLGAMAQTLLDTLWTGRWPVPKSDKKASPGRTGR